MVATFGNGTTAAACAAGLTVNAMAPTPLAPSMAKAVDILIEKLDSGKKVEPIVMEESRKSDEFLKAQEAKPAKKARPRKNPAETPPTKKAL